MYVCISCRYTHNITAPPGSAADAQQDCVTGIDVAPLPSAAEYDCSNALLYTAEQAGERDGDLFFSQWFDQKKMGHENKTTWTAGYKQHISRVGWLVAIWQILKAPGPHISNRPDLTFTLHGKLGRGRHVKGFASGVCFTQLAKANLSPMFLLA
jgi:hypothetical protein